MRRFPVDDKRLVRDDAVSRQLLTSKSTDDLFPRAIPCMKRRASAESSAGWVTHDEILSRRHSTRCRRSFAFAIPKLMSSFDVPFVEGKLQREIKEEDAYFTARQGIDITLVPSSTASAAITPTSSVPDFSFVSSPLRASYMGRAFSSTGSDGASTPAEEQRSTAATAVQHHTSTHTAAEVATLLARALPRGAPAATAEQHHTSTSFSVDGESKLASGDFDGTCKVWDSSTGALLPADEVAALLARYLPRDASSW